MFIVVAKLTGSPLDPHQPMLRMNRHREKGHVQFGPDSVPAYKDFRIRIQVEIKDKGMTGVLRD